jgi:hypothetical protein
MTTKEPIRNPVEQHPCRRTQRKKHVHKTCSCDGGFTQTWDTTGAGTTSHDGRSQPRRAQRSYPMKLSVRLRGKHAARETTSLCKRHFISHADILSGFEQNDLQILPTNPRQQQNVSTATSNKRCQRRLSPLQLALAIHMQHLRKNETLQRHNMV